MTATVLSGHVLGAEAVERVQQLSMSPEQSDRLTSFCRTPKKRSYCYTSYMYPWLSLSIPRLFHASFNEDGAPIDAA